MTQLEIILDYNKSKKQADEIDKVADRLERLNKNILEGALTSLKSAWRSDNSPQFHTKADKVQEDIKDSVKNLRNVAMAIRNTAESVRDAELRALEVAKDRTY